MHELSLATAIVDTVVRHAEGRRVAAITVRAGTLRQVVPESLEFYLGFTAQGTVCEGSRLELEVVPARLACAACGEEWEPAPFRCAACGGSDVAVVAGDELLVESIELEEDACIART